MKITRERRQRVPWRDFERLSLARVAEFYPDVDCLLTDLSADGGRNGEGARRVVETGL
ncbi:MAG TPA: hypothetical protein VJ032_06210 [Thermoanaerobaculia bacterium]|nr:hypothetical protein [Thermoanaerobaculia bacterium]